MEKTETTKLNNELLNADQAPIEDKPIKRNSKDQLISNILKVVEQYQLDFDYSVPKLKRMNKEQLTKLLAEVMEQSVLKDMAKSVGVDPRGGGKVITLGALRMIHNIAAVGFEKCFNQFASPYVGMESNGFSESLKDPTVQSSVDECLAEIAAENPEILEYFDSPYTRLALIWSGAMLSCLRKKMKNNNLRNNINNGFSGMEPRSARNQAPSGFSSGRGSKKREIDSGDEPRVHNV